MTLHPATRLPVGNVLIALAAAFAALAVWAFAGSGGIMTWGERDGAASPAPALAVDGEVTVSMDNPRTGEWRAGFQAVAPDNGDFTDCEWHRRADELTIRRRDRTETPQGLQERKYELRLRRSNSTARL